MLTLDFRRPANPFATRYTAPGASPYRWLDPVDGKIRSSDCDPLDWLVCRVFRHRCSAIVGPHGSGKSSLLTALETPLRRQFSRVRRLRLQPTSSLWQAVATARAIGKSNAGELWLVDGLERLGPVWLRFVCLAARARGVSLLVTVHRERGFLPVVWRTDLDESFAKRLTVDRLLDWPGYADSLLDSWEDRWLRAAGNLRELWFQLFDEFEMLDRASSASRSSNAP